ncbi:uncharacterized protein [Thunnus thynnus]|uniref:uncharacterized protein n=1 Tax=Thunnus thynnus TaxID=8237 RepID=UPI00352921D5
MGTRTTRTTRAMRVTRTERQHEEREEEEEHEEHEEHKDEERGEEGETETYLSKNRKLTWSSSAACKKRGRRGGTTDQKVPTRSRLRMTGTRTGTRTTRTMTPNTAGPTPYAVSRTRDIVSTFYLFFTPAIDKLIQETTNPEGFRKYGEGWKPMNNVDVHAYVGLLILAGVYRSRGEAVASLWDLESGRAIFCATMPLKLFYRHLKLIRFDDRKSRSARHATNKLATVREVWDMWADSE